MTDDAAYLEADADDARHALHEAGLIVAARGDTGLTEGNTAWLHLAELAYYWLRNRVSLRASTITVVPGTPEKEGSPVSTVFDLSDVDQVTFTLSATPRARLYPYRPTPGPGLCRTPTTPPAP